LTGEAQGQQLSFNIAHTFVLFITVLHWTAVLQRGLNHVLASLLR
jgi:hypothetical protein